MEERDWLQNVRALDSQAKQVAVLEELARGLGYAVDEDRNAVKTALQKNAGILVTDEKIFELAKLYLGYGIYAPGAAALALADLVIFPNFSSDQLFENILSQIAPGNYDAGVPPMQNVLSAVRTLQKQKSSKPTIAVSLALTYPIETNDTEWQHFFGGLRMMLTMRDVKMVVLSAKLEAVPESLAKMLPAVMPKLHG